MNIDSLNPQPLTFLDFPKEIQIEILPFNIQARSLLANQVISQTPSVDSALNRKAMIKQISSVRHQADPENDHNHYSIRSDPYQSKKTDPVKKRIKNAIAEACRLDELQKYYSYITNPTLLSNFSRFESIFFSAIEYVDFTYPQNYPVDPKSLQVVSAEENIPHTYTIEFLAKLSTVSKSCRNNFVENLKIMEKNYQVALRKNQNDVDHLQIRSYRRNASFLAKLLIDQEIKVLFESIQGDYGKFFSDNYALDATQSQKKEQKMNRTLQMIFKETLPPLSRFLTAEELILPEYQARIDLLKAHEYTNIDKLVFLHGLINLFEMFEASFSKQRLIHRKILMIKEQHFPDRSYTTSAHHKFWKRLLSIDI